MILAKNCETVSKFVKVMARILWPLFFPDTATAATLSVNQTIGQSVSQSVN